MNTSLMVLAVMLALRSRVARAQADDSQVTYFGSDSGPGRLRQGRADGRGGGLQDPREPARRARNGRDPHPRHRHRLRAQGSATLVTGGTALGPRSRPAPEELRGSGIVGGETRSSSRAMSSSSPTARRTGSRKSGCPSSITWSRCARPAAGRDGDHPMIRQLVLAAAVVALAPGTARPRRPWMSRGAARRRRRSPHRQGASLVQAQWRYSDVGISVGSPRAWLRSSRQRRREPDQ